MAVAKESQSTGLVSSNDDSKQLIHCCSDNFDCEISLQNYKHWCHDLGIILAQIMSRPHETAVDTRHRTVPHQPMQDHSKTIEYNIVAAHYNLSNQ